MKLPNRKEKIRIKKSHKRLKIALYFLILILFFTSLGFLVRNSYQKTFTLFESEKILEPIARQATETELAKELKKSNLGVISLSINGEREILASLSGDTQVIFKSEGIAQQVSSLQIMLSRFRIEGRIPKKIDLRFEKPIVVF